MDHSDVVLLTVPQFIRRCTHVGKFETLVQPIATRYNPSKHIAGFEDVTTRESLNSKPPQRLQQGEPVVVTSPAGLPEKESPLIIPPAAVPTPLTPASPASATGAGSTAATSSQSIFCLSNLSLYLLDNLVEASGLGV